VHVLVLLFVRDVVLVLVPVLDNARNEHEHDIEHEVEHEHEHEHDIEHKVEHEHEPEHGLTRLAVPSRSASGTR
jgi:ABC-type Zn2+ transport system substrate-binding protein/surface adhesin